MFYSLFNSVSLINKLYDSRSFSVHSAFNDLENLERKQLSLLRSIRFLSLERKNLSKEYAVTFAPNNDSYTFQLLRSKARSVSR